MVTNGFTLAPNAKPMRRVWRGQSAFWAGSESLFGIALLAALVSVALTAPPLGDSFMLFYASGLLPLAAFVDVTVKCAPVLRQVRAKQRPLAGSDFEIAIHRLASAFLVQVIVSAIVLGTLGLWLNTYDTNVLAIIAAYLALGILCLGFGAFNCWITDVFPRWPRFWAALIRPLFVISGVFFLVDDVPDPFRDWLMWNPLAHVIGMIRAGIYPYYAADYAAPVFVGLVGLTALVAGLAGLVFLNKGATNAID